MLKEIPLNKSKINNGFWKYYIDTIRQKTIPFQYRAINNDEAVSIKNENKSGVFEDKKSNALENLRIAAGLSKGDHYGTIFQDSDVYKWLEAVAYSLQLTPDAKLQSLADEVVALIAAAQAEDGYISTYFQLREPRLKYRMLYYGHELYCMGHYLEAAVAYHEATGSQKVLEIAEKIIANLDQTFGYGEGQIPGADGHQEVEIGLLKYYELTGNRTALKLADFFLNVRGEDPDFYAKQLEKNLEEGLSNKYNSIARSLHYLQAYTQPRNQRTAESHAVRMLYMAAAMARLVRHTGDMQMKEACDAIWENVTGRRMYVTAGVGSAADGEAFTGDYDLPNDTMYCETCASIALVFFAYELFKIQPKAEYMEVIERALYNGILAGASDDGIHFFYVNPLEVHGDICDTNPGLDHVRYERPEWYSCACCPPNFARTIGSMQRYIYTEQEEENTLYINLFAASQVTLERAGITVIQKTEFPYENKVTFQIKGDGRPYTLKIRIPGWASSWSMRRNGNIVEESIETPEFSGTRGQQKWADGYLTFTEQWTDETMELFFESPVMAVKANPKVAADASRVAVQRGPLVFCAEQIDNSHPLTSYRLLAADIKAAVTERGENSPCGCLRLTVKAYVEKLEGKQSQNRESLYIFDPEMSYEETRLSLIPYYAWANRNSRDMMVWFHQR